MNKAELKEHHHEGLHPCLVLPTTAPNLVVICPTCTVHMEAEFLSPCEGNRHDSRVILILLCPNCDSTGQLRFERSAPWIEEPPVPTEPTGTVTVRAGQQGYLHLYCDCGGGGVFHYRGHHESSTHLTLYGVPGCGHQVELSIPRTAQFKTESHRHGR